ncbi:MAG TPA: flavin reductase family protein [Candidatus Binataceae bacterium]|nr:flavin reductase family protein [Candidatus Binataceae bacterium]
MPIERNELRRVMGHFATGVTVITTVSKSGTPYGLTANAFTSVSLEPPLLLIAVDKKAESYPFFNESKVFTVNILSDEQESLSRKFAVSGGDKFQGVAYRMGANGAPILEGALAYLECKLFAAYDGGDHTLFLGEIEQAETRELKPLLFYRGGYRSISG